MSESLESFRRNLSETMLNFIWEQWSSIGVMANAGAAGQRLVDPEPLLLLTLEVARQDPRIFDEVVDWLMVNGKWINVVRLSRLLTADKVGRPDVLGAVAATLSRYDKTLKWRSLAKRLKPKRTGEPVHLFQKGGKPLLLEGTATDAIFRSYGLLRTPLKTRRMSTPVVPSPTPLWTSSNFIFKARALFGVNIRADVFSFLVLQGAANPTKIARQLGYSQRRVQDTVSDMAAADVFKMRTVGKAKEYFVDSESVRGLLGGTECNATWFDCRALARGLTTIWRRAFTMREDDLTPYILQSEQDKVLREVKNDLLGAVPQRKLERRAEQSRSVNAQGLMPSLHSALLSTPAYTWNRFWVPRGGLINYADGGFPFIPKKGDFWSGSIQSDHVDFASICQIPCLVFLGEPGMGKSFALKEAIRTLDVSQSGTPTKLLFLDLKSYGSEERLVRDLFESETFRSWARGEHDLHLFLDSFDEALLHQSTLANLISDKLTELPSVKGLFFRIACRTAEWPTILETGLRTKWGGEHLKILQLVPLTRADVAQAAEAGAVDPEEFLRAVESLRAAPLAFKPITLKFLLKLFHGTEKLAASQKELYSQGCHILCEEANESRIGARLTGKLTSQQRMELAAHIAAASVLCNRNAIWTGPSGGLASDRDLTLDELCAGTVGEQRQPITRESLMEVLATGLFSSRGPDRLGWAHQTYAEFLAAWHLCQSGIGLDQIHSLLLHAGDSERRVVPQLHETAAWLAGMHPQLFRELVKTDPEVLLRSDVAAASPEDKQKLVDSLLAQVEEDKLLHLDWSWTTHYQKVAHTGLADQLRPYILDSTGDRRVRLEAIRIADACKLKELAADLTLVALDSSEHESIRAGAAEFVVKVGEPACRARLKALLNLPAELDPSDELKGWALQVCWPACLNAEELFQVLTPPKRETYFGAYWTFLKSDFIQNLSPSDLCVALKWVRKQPARRHFNLSFSFEQLIDEVLDQAAQNIENAGVLPEFAKTILDRLRKHDHSFRQEPQAWQQMLRTNSNLRRCMITNLLSEMANPEKDAFYLSCCGVNVVTCEDVVWLAECLDHEQNPQNQIALAHLIRRTFQVNHAADVDAVIRAGEKFAFVRELFSFCLRPVSLDSDEARKAREQYAEEKRLEDWVTTTSQDHPVMPPPAERVAKLLDRFERELDLDAWWRLVMELTLEPTSTHYEHEGKADLTQLPGWLTADAQTRARFISAAKRYVIDRDANPDAWFWKENIWHRPAAAGYKALLLLQKEAPEMFAQLPTEVWAKWASIIVHEARYEVAGHEVIARAAYRAAPEDFLLWLDRIIDRESQRAGHLTLLRQLDVNSAWDDRLAKALLKKARTPGLSWGVLMPLLESLLAHGVTEAKELTQVFVQLPFPQEQQRRDQILDAAEALLTYCHDAWPFVWPAMHGDPEFGRMLIGRIAGRYHLSPAPIVDKLTAEQVANLYVWLVGQFPPEKDPTEQGAHLVSALERLADFKNGLVSHLRDRGTPDACEAIQKLINQFPMFKWLKWMLAEARAAVRKKDWTPPCPRDLFRMFANAELRLVRDANELFSLVVESLGRLGKAMRGETPISEFLWNKVPGTKFYRPKDENSVTNFIKMHLDSDLRSRGIVVNREVEIRRGEETDIHIDAVCKQGGISYDRVTVIIEVKGSWNRDLETAIESQLLRYLHDNACRHGLYLIGWFNCPQWDEKDYRKKASSRTECDEARSRLHSVAQKVSGSALKIEEFVLNASLRPNSDRPPHAESHKEDKEEIEHQSECQNPRIMPAANI